jgi:hypothetical protein
MPPWHRKAAPLVWPPGARVADVARDLLGAFEALQQRPVHVSDADGGPDPIMIDEQTEALAPRIVAIFGNIGEIGG